jgi:diguanylate cyclase (GGDEF)-like protein
VETLRTALAGWEAGYQLVNQAFTSDKWRTDIVLLTEKIDPLFSGFREQLSTLQRELSIETAKDITQLTHIAKRLSDFVIIISILGISFILAAFVLFNRTLLIPIAHVTHALKVVAQGMKGVQVPHSSVEEIQNLTTAFSEMRNQVQIRERHLDHLAHHDPLTCLPNRMLFRDRLEQALLRADREDTLVGLMFIDLDNFKNINDSLGHESGDGLLKCVAERLKNCLRQSDTVARLGGDEFAVLVPGLTGANQIELVARKISNSLARSFQLEQHLLHVTASIGITLYPQDEIDAEALIKDADIAMYHAKELGRNRFQFYSREMTTRILGRIEIETALREALEKEQFDVFFQPIVDIHNGGIISAEALLRWHHPRQGLISAGQHIAILEETGLIEPVTLWVLQRVCACYESCRNAARVLVNISINLSGKLLRRKSFVRAMLAQLEQSNMDPRHLIVEVTEDTLLDDLQASSVVMHMLTDMGIRIAMDDFGTRQSSLSHLRHNPIDIVKIDKDFVQDIPHNRGDSQLVAAIIAMAHSLEMHVVAEGVEKSEQLDFLIDHKCDSIQGYLFSPAVPLEQLLTLIENERQPAEAEI